MEWETVIGLEVHVQLQTQSKIFSGAPVAYGAEPNRQACAIDLGLPGVLPVLNRAAVDMALTFGVSIGAHIPDVSVFARKNYFYPDLPKGYQISQHLHPIVGEGTLTIRLKGAPPKTIGIERAHLEEDAGKSLHEDIHGCTGIDLNRAGTPLLEIVSKPDLRSAEEAVAYLKTLHALVTCLGICDGNMQEGSMRCDANVSVRPKGQSTLGTRTETKNVNSFRFVEKAIHYEVKRQIHLLESGHAVTQETRLYDAVRNETRPMRGKEEAHDYRYFPDPDLLPLYIAPEQVQRIKESLPELPWEKETRFQQDYGLSEYDAHVLVGNPALADYFESLLKADISPKLAANWVMGELSAALNKHQIAVHQSPVAPAHLAGLLKRIEDRTVSGSIAKTLFEALWNQEGKDADSLIAAKGLQQITDIDALEAIVDEVIANNPQQLAQYRAGQEKLKGYFVGQVMKATQGKANPQQVNELLQKKL